MLPERFSTPRGQRQRGTTLVEVLVTSALLLAIMLMLYTFAASSERVYATESDITSAKASGRAVIDVMSAELRAAGYSPLGASFDAIVAGDALGLRLLADLDGDAIVGTETEPGENLSYRFEDPEADGVFELIRGRDYNGDGDFDDTDESAAVVATHLVPIDADQDGVAEPFLVYDAEPPDTRLVTITFGARTAHTNRVTGEYEITRFQTAVLLRNRR